MKKIGLLLLLSLSVAARAAEKEVKLLGISTGFGVNYAVMNIPNERNSSEVVVLGDGQQNDGVQLVRVDAVNGEATVNVNGQERQLAMPADAESGATNSVDVSSAVMSLRAVPLQTAIEFYAKYTKRTVLMHPQVGNPPVSFKASPRTEAEAAAMLEKQFNNQNIATIPDGKHIVMVVPFAFTNSVTPRASSLLESNSLIPEMSANFNNAPIAIVLQVYADFVHKKIVNLDNNGGLTCCDTITFVQSAPMSRDELSYALQTLIEWHHIRMVPDANGDLKLERIERR